MEDRYIGAAVACILPVIERAGLLAADYTKYSGRTILTSKDMEYAMKYCARFKVGEPRDLDVSDSDSDSDSDLDIQTVDESEEPFTRYSGNDPLMKAINDCYDTWNEWEPSNPIEHMLKDAIDKNMYSD
jgi:hypothetical protein